VRFDTVPIFGPFRGNEHNLNLNWTQEILSVEILGGFPQSLKQSLKSSWFTY